MCPCSFGGVRSYAHLKDQVGNLKSWGLTKMDNLHIYDMCIYYAYEGGVYVENIDPLWCEGPTQGFHVRKQCALFTAVVLQ